MGTVLLEAALVQHVDARTTGLGYATIKKKLKKERTGNHRRICQPNEKNSQQCSTRIKKKPEHY